jgi:hypothetical protein
MASDKFLRPLNPGLGFRFCITATGEWFFPITDISLIKTQNNERQAGKLTPL